MKHIEIDEELYQFLASNTQFIGESASSILRRLLSLPMPETAKQQDIQITTIEPLQAVEEKVENKQPQPAEVPVDDENVFNYINKEELAMQRGAIGRFLLILAALYRVHPQQFSLVNNIRGRDRLYFAQSESLLAQSGSSTKPRQIPDSDYWVMTNSNTTRKKMMLTEVAKVLGYQAADIERIRDLL